MKVRMWEDVVGIGGAETSWRNKNGRSGMRKGGGPVGESENGAEGFLKYLKMSCMKASVWKNVVGI